MLANFFGKSKPVNFIVLFTLFLCYFSFHLFSRELTIEATKEFIGFTIIFTIFNFIIAKNQLTFDNSFGFLIFVLLIGFFPDVIKVDKIFYASLTILLFLRKAYSLQSSKNVFSKLYDGGLWLGISFLIEPYTVFFALLFYISIYLHQRFTYQTLLLPLIGFSSIVFLFFTYCFWYDKTIVFYKLFKWNFSYNLNTYANTKYMIPLLCIGFLVFSAILLKSPRALAVLNTFRKNWILICIHLLLSLIVVLFITPKTGSEMLFIFFPISIILANGLELFQHKWQANILLSIILISSIFIYLF
ncbi:DUF6427 family protein [Tenacibaculum aestuariivivum]|uniref:DUF6427 family protein n=1 Tax=Tenacibaculum aestuariivivum TaxID=2006131 RepID=UPI003AB85B58